VHIDEQIAIEDPCAKPGRELRVLLFWLDMSSFAGEHAQNMCSFIPQLYARECGLAGSDWRPAST